MILFGYQIVLWKQNYFLTHFRKTFILIKCLCVLYVHVDMCKWVQVPEENRNRFCGARVRGSGCWEHSWDPLGEQHALSPTEPSFQTPPLYTFKKFIVILCFWFPVWNFPVGICVTLLEEAARRGWPFATVGEDTFGKLENCLES